MIGRNMNQDMAFVPKPPMGQFGADTQYQTNVARAGSLVSPNRPNAVKPSLLNIGQIPAVRVNTVLPAPLKPSLQVTKIKSNYLFLPTAQSRG